MVFVLELDDNDSSLLSHRHLHDAIIASSPTASPDAENTRHISQDGDVEDRPNPNLNGFSAALGCYP
jgi:hypothetical protein